MNLNYAIISWINYGLYLYSPNISSKALENLISLAFLSCEPLSMFANYFSVIGNKRIEFNILIASKVRSSLSACSSKLEQLSHLTRQSFLLNLSPK